MAYYMRLFSKSLDLPPLDVFASGLTANVSMEVVSGSGDNWSQLLVKSKDGRDLCVLERNLRGHEALAEEEIGEFVEFMKDAEPCSAADWVTAYLGECRATVACQFLNGAFDDDLGGLPATILWNIQSVAGGILQADGEGFSNEEGFQITWDFSDTVSGHWNVAVLVAPNEWACFEMDLGDDTHRAAFKSGRVPPDIDVE